jgi:murein DD-endopeptidase MepM/ murein hydrolase activator NlpD
MFKLLSRLIKLLLAVLLLPVAVFAGLAIFRVGPPPEIDLQSDRPGIGRRTTFDIRVREPERGLGRITVTLEQNGQTHVLASNANKTYRPRRFWAFWGPLQAEEQLKVVTGRDVLPSLRSGTAVVRVTAERAGTWLRKPAAVTKEASLTVRFTPPSLERASTQVYLAQGGSEVVVYRVGETSVKDGVQAGDWFFPGYPLPGGNDRERMVLFAMPYDVADAGKVRLTAQDDLGNQVAVACIDKFFPKPFKNDTIQLSDAFMSKVVPEILAQTSEIQDRGDLLESYLALNRDLRKLNAARLVELGAQSKPEFLWRRVFLPVANAAVKSSFADRRTYLYNGKAVDQQDHLGFDMASVQHAPIVAVNDGVVVLAEYFGIYGNTVVVDHGYGLQSLYGHLSTIGVKEGDRVTRGQELGRSGATGLAAGDHLHFAFLLHGLAVNPVEWWDEHWITDRLARKLGPALPFEPTAAAKS